MTCEHEDVISIVKVEGDVITFYCFDCDRYVRERWGIVPAWLDEVQQ